jgi:hypothetical protein
MKYIRAMFIILLMLVGFAVGAPSAQANHLGNTWYNGDGYGTGWGVGVSIDCTQNYDYIIARGERSGNADCVWAGAGGCLWIQAWINGRNVSVDTVRGPNKYRYNGTNTSLTVSSYRC